MGYAHIDNLYKNQDMLMFKECYAMEKIHGTSAHISFTRKRQIVFGNPWEGTEEEWQELWPDEITIHFFSGGEKHENFVKLFDKSILSKKFREMVVPHLVIFGEAYGGKCQGMSATYGKELKFVAFDVRMGEFCWLGVPDAEEIVKSFGLEFVHYVKCFTDLIELDKQRDADSVQAVRNNIGLGKKREGVVLRPLIEVRKNNGERICAKHKRDDFQETKTPRKVVSPEQLKIWTEVKETAKEWCTNMRFLHVIDKIENKMDFKAVIDAMLEDITREGDKEIVWSNDLRKQIAQMTGGMLKQYLKTTIK